jgi:hypothetical protein
MIVIAWRVSMRLVKASRAHHSRYPRTLGDTLNAFYEHHQHRIAFHYRCFDRIPFNALIQPFQQLDLTEILCHLERVYEEQRRLRISSSNYSRSQFPGVKSLELSSQKSS